MMFKYLTNAWRLGKFSIGFQSQGDSTHASIEGGFFPRLAYWLLKKQQRREFFNLVTEEAQAMKEARLSAALSMYEDQYSSRQRALEADFSVDDIESICVNVWDEPAEAYLSCDSCNDTNDEMMIYVEAEDDIPAAIEKEVLALVQEAMRGTKAAHLYNLNPELTLFDGAKVWPELLLQGEVHAQSIYRRWELRQKLPLDESGWDYEAADDLANDLNKLNLKFQNIDLEFISES